MGTIKLLARLAIRQKGEKAITDRVLASARDEKASFYSFSDEDMVLKHSVWFRTVSNCR